MEKNIEHNKILKVILNYIKLCMNYSLFKTMSNSKNDCYEFYTTFP